MKKINFHLTIFCIMLSWCALSEHLFPNHLLKQDDFGNTVYVDDEDDDIFAFDEEIDFEFEDTFRIPSIAETDLWYKTDGARTRDSLFLPFSKRSLFDPDGINFNIIYNQSKKIDASPDISISKKAILLLTEVGGNIDGLATTLKLLPFVRKVAIWEHKLGIPIQAGKTFNNWTIQLETALLTCIRHFWLNQKDRRIVQQILQENASEDRLSPPDLYKVTAGLGDTRIKLGYNLINNTFVKTNVGLSGIIPTSKLRIRNKKLPIITAKPGDRRTELYQNLLNTAPRIMLQPKLGTGHWGLGTYLDMKMCMIPNTLDFWSRVSMTYMLPGYESRYMPSKQFAHVADLVTLHSSEFIPEDFPIRDYFPYLASAYVHPGHIVNATLGLDWYNQNWKISWGYDFYAQQAEKISRIKIDEIDPTLLKPEQAISGHIVQHKIFANIEHLKKRKNHDITFGIGGHVSISSKGTPRDWSIFGKIGITF